MKRFAVIQFPGSNCERETILALKRVGCEPVPFLWNEPAEKLAACDGCVIVGGFSYEDRGRAGIITSLSPLMNTIKQMNEANKPILGICNGAQILVESGLVPGIKNNTLAMALTTNKRIQNGHIIGTGFYNNWVHVKNISTTENAFNKYLKEPMHIPLAHAEGRFVIPDKLLQELQQQQIGMLQYCDTNPNGSDYNLAAVCNTKGNIMAIMPHPERTPNGDAIFASMRDYIPQPNSTTLNFTPKEITISPYKLPANNHELIIELLITDNAAFSIEQALHDNGLKVTVQRYTHWQIAATENIDNLITSEELFNPRKEKIITNLNHNLSFLTQEKENIEGNYKLEHLKHQPEFATIKSLTKGTIWSFTSTEEMLAKTKTFLFNKHILYNPYVANCYLF